MTHPHALPPPSDWVCRWAHLIPNQTRPGARVLDLACGHGRHSRWLVARGCHVTALDRDAEALNTLSDLSPQAHTVLADLENQPWPLGDAAFDGVVVTNYLWRPLWPHLLASVVPGGVLIYETFSHGQANIGKPSRPDFLLQPGELLRVCADWTIVAFEDGFLPQPPRCVQRICALRPAVPPHQPPLRQALHPTG